MAETDKQVQSNYDEMDLVDILDRFSRFFFTYRYTLIISALMGVVCAVVIYLALPKSYESTLILHSQILTNSEEIAIVDNWNELRKNGEYGVLSASLNCDVSLLKKTSFISAANIVSAQPSSGFTVEVYVKDTSILPALQKAIIYGLENNEFVRQKVEFRRNSTVQMLQNITQEIAKLDSTKKRIESNSSIKGPGSSFIMNISDVNIQMITLKEKLYQYKEVLSFVDAIQVLQNFEKYARPASPRFSILMVSGLLGGLFIGFMVSLLKVARSKIDILREQRRKQPANSARP